MYKFVISGFADEIDKDIRIQFETLNELGIGYVEVRGVNGRNIATLSDAQLFGLKAAMQQTGIRASSIGSPIGKIFVNEDFEKHFECFRRVVEIAEELESKYIRIFSFYLPQGEVWDTYRDIVIARLSQMTEYAKSHNIVLLHENEKDIYGETADRCVDLLTSVNSNYLRAVFDPANFVQCQENVREAYTKLSPYIEYMHIKDAIADGTVVPSGYGNGELPFILKKLKESGYQGFLSLEPHLGDFEGLRELEINKKPFGPGKSTKTTFALAFDALKAVLEGIE